MEEFSPGNTNCAQSNNTVPLELPIKRWQLLGKLRKHRHAKLGTKTEHYYVYVKLNHGDSCKKYKKRVSRSAMKEKARKKNEKAYKKKYFGDERKRKAKYTARRRTIRGRWKSKRNGKS